MLRVHKLEYSCIPLHDCMYITFLRYVHMQYAYSVVCIVLHVCVCAYITHVCRAMYKVCYLIRHVILASQKVC